MSLDATRLGTAISTAIAAAIPGTSPTVLAAMSNAIASAVVTEIKTNGVVVPTALIAPGGLSPAPVTGTGTIT